jgi:NAD(P)-dependent dehydrogenase (short-subunit alcohol dehydrogenase family)
VSSALLTGVTGGWGRAVLERFVEAGWDVTATYLPHEPEPALPEGALAVPADLTDATAAERAVDAALERFGRLDALANVAGGFQMGGDLHEAPIDVWHGQLRMNLDTAYYMTRAALRPMRASGRGSIVFVSSAAAVRPFRGAAAYTVSKAAVIALMEAVDAEVRTLGIRANAVLPKIVDTPRNRAENPDADYARWTRGEELAEVILWLCSDASSPLSGGAIPAYGRA